jgi:hypothetical protein
MFCLYALLLFVMDKAFPSHPFLTAESPHNMLRKSLNTCYRFPKHEGVNVLLI